jgi:hypothetical protein
MRVWLPRMRFWRRCAVGFGVLFATLLIVNAVFAWRAHRRLQAKLAEIRAAGDPASIADLAPHPIPEDQNAAAILKGLAPRLEAFSDD